ncbi:hypothetical protein ABE504_29180 [Paenibacillus oryzisoli]|uniref:hypothetical protein n=1 Tax=Paenibacillus oryzisoli TaxID=1850517 RepID=UPI003D2E0BCB
MLKKLASLALAGAIIASVPAMVFAEDTQGSGAPTQKAEALHPLKQLLQEKAAAFGITTDGKTKEQIKAEIKSVSEADRLAHLQAVAAKLGIQTDGKTAEQLKTDVQAAAHTKLAAKADKLGVSSDGKTNKELRAALKAAKAAKKAEHDAKRADAVNKKAAKLGISTDGKTTAQVFAEIESALQAKWAKKVQQ